MRAIVAAAIAATAVFSLLPAMAWAASMPVAIAASGLSEYGIEGIRMVSTPADEEGATISANGQRIVWAVRGRESGAGGSDLWQARRVDGRWQDAAPLAINTDADEGDPAFSPDGHWLYFSSNRDGGAGGFDLYRATVLDDGRIGAVEHLGPAINSEGNERAPMPGPDGSVLLFASDGHGGAGGLDLLLARWDGDAFIEPVPLPGTVNTAADETDPAWLAGGATLLFTRDNADASQIQVAHCDGVAYGEAEPLKLSFNAADARTIAPAPDWSKPTELLVAGSARAPRAGGLDLYRAVSPKVAGRAGCLD